MNLQGPVRLQGVDAQVEAVQQRLDFYWGRNPAGYWGSDGWLSLRPDRCVSVTARPFRQDGSVHLVFRFRPTAPVARGGSSHVIVDLIVAAERAEQARRFVERLAYDHGVQDVTWGVARRAEHAARPCRVPSDDPDWLSAPASARTEALFEWVTERLAVADG